MVEGLDGSGKSTLARDLARALGARFMTTPEPALRTLREPVLDALGGSQLARQVFYLSTVIAAADRIRRHLHRGESVVVDRYLLSTMVYAAQRGAGLRWPELEESLLRPDRTLLLDLPLSVRRQRLELRGTSAADRESLDPVFAAGVLDGYRAWAREGVAGPVAVIRLTGTESTGEVLARALALLGVDA